MARAASISDPGGRAANEDCCNGLELNGATCWVVADGLGGHRGGQEASRTAVERILASFGQQPELSPGSLSGHLEAAQAAILERQQKEPELHSMHTTAALLVTDGDKALWAHIGDTRIYHLRGGRILFQSKDHSVCQVLAEAGEIKPEEIRFHEDRNRLLRSLGKVGRFAPAVHSEPLVLQQGDAFLLCTDGFWEYVTEPEMEEDLASSEGPQDWLDRLRQRLLSRASGEHDNYTATAVRFEEFPCVTP